MPKIQRKNSLKGPISTLYKNKFFQVLKEFHATCSRLEYTLPMVSHICFIWVRLTQEKNPLVWSYLMIEM